MCDTRLCIERLIYDFHSPDVQRAQDSRRKRLQQLTKLRAGLDRVRSSNEQVRFRTRTSFLFRDMFAFTTEFCLEAIDPFLPLIQPHACDIVAHNFEL